jgi:putative tricarboxylic transport membrane protein
MARYPESVAIDGQPLAWGKTRVVLAPGIFLLMGLWICLETRQLPLGSFRMPEAGFFPLLLGITLSVLALILLAVNLVTVSPGSGEALAPRPEILVLIGSLFASAWLFERGGYLLTMTVFLVIVLKTLAQVRWMNAVALALLGSIVSYLLFDRILMIALPSGILPF